MRAHPLVLARHGGELTNVTLQDYVKEIGLRLAQASLQPEEAWTFTVLDDPAIRAFAQPGGYVYVSRGLIAFANSEAELAAMIAHQMAHLTRNHLGRGERRPLGTGLAAGANLDGLIAARSEQQQALPPSARETGRAPVMSVEQEVAAAREGTMILAKANYDTSAAASIVRRLVAQDKAALPGALRVEVLGVTQEDRAAAAAAIDEATGTATVFEAEVGRNDYLLTLQGMLYGPSPSQGFVRDNHFVHPALGFTFEAPEGFALTHSPAEVVARGPGGAQMILDTTDDAGPRLESYVRDTWAPSLTRLVEVGYLYDLRSLVLGGLEAATAFQPFEDDTGPKVAQLTVIRAQDRIYRFRAIAPAEDIEASIAMEDALSSFRLLSAAEAAAERPFWIHVHEVRRGDSVNLFSAAMPMREDAESRFRRLNGLAEREVLPVGSLVKMVMH